MEATRYVFHRPLQLLDELRVLRRYRHRLILQTVAEHGEPSEVQAAEIIFPVLLNPRCGFRTDGAWCGERTGWARHVQEKLRAVTLNFISHRRRSSASENRRHADKRMPQDAHRVVNNFRPRHGYLVINLREIVCGEAEINPAIFRD